MGKKEDRHTNSNTEIHWMWMGGLLGSFRLKKGFKCHFTYGTVFLEHVGCSGENDQIDLPFLS